MAGDTLTPELLLEHADWVRTLARSLVFDEDRVDDVVQETWVAALKAPPATTERLRGWLAAVVRNVARQTGRAEGRRRRRERATTPPPPGPSAAEVAGRAALQRELVDHVFALDEPYRDVVLLRYFEGLTPKRIAALRGTPTATVKTRLQRALERLRGRLDTEHGDRSAWCAALLPLAAKGGGVTVGAKGLAAAAACALLAGTWFATAPAPRESASAAAPAALAPSSEEPLDESTDRGERATSRNDGIPRADEAPSRDAVPSATPTPADDAPHRLAGRVIDERGRPLGGVTVRAVDPDALRWQDERETTLVGRSFWMPLPKERRDALRADLAALDAFVAREFTDPVAARALILGGEPPVVSTRTAPDGSFVLEARTTSARARVVDPRWCIVGEAKPPPPEDAAQIGRAH
ncbi:MAG: RNA polymerase sigma factor, partial [Planctomycetota bacterium JB042]